MSDGENENDNRQTPQDPTVVLDAHRGLMAQKATDARRHQSAVRADLDAVRAGQASLEKHLFAGPATGWPQAAEKADYLLRLFANTGEGQDPRYKQLIEDALSDFARLAGKAKESAP